MWHREISARAACNKIRITRQEKEQERQKELHAKGIRRFLRRARRRDVREAAADIRTALKCTFLQASKMMRRAYTRKRETAARIGKRDREKRQREGKKTRSGAEEDVGMTVGRKKRGRETERSAVKR